MTTKLDRIEIGLKYACREVLENSRMKTIMESIQHKTKSTNEETNLFVTYIFLALTYRNWQQPGPALNLTLSEAKEATEKDGKLIIHSACHKTALTYGPAILALNGDDTIYFKHFIQNIRPKISTSSSMECALVTARGQPLHHYRDMINSLCRKLGVPTLPTLTATRKAGATLAVGQTTQETLENISAHMSHSKSTSE